MNAYVASVIDYVKQAHGNEPEFVQTVEEVLSSVSPIMDAHPEYEKVDLLKRMVEPERMFTFRVCWMDEMCIRDSARFERIRLSRPTRYVRPTAARPKRNEPAVMTA